VAFIAGSVKLLASFGISMELGAAIISVLIVSFANTTLDSSCRIQQLSLQKILKDTNENEKSPAKQVCFNGSCGY
jgi:carbon starvation protein